MNENTSPKLKTFNGKRYTRNVWGLAKWVAQKQADKLRKEGKNAHIYHNVKDGWWVVYQRD